MGWDVERASLKWLIDRAAAIGPAAPPTPGPLSPSGAGGGGGGGGGAAGGRRQCASAGGSTGGAVPGPGAVPEPGPGRAAAKACPATAPHVCYAGPAKGGCARAPWSRTDCARSCKRPKGFD